MQVDLEIPDSLVRKIRALNILSGGSSDIESYLVGLIDEIVTNQMADYLGLRGPVKLPPPQAQPAARAQSLDVTEIADGLGDIDDTADEEPIAGPVSPDDFIESVIPPEKNPEAFVAGGGGLTESLLDEDELVDDPITESVASASEESTDDLFSLAPQVVLSPQEMRRKARTIRGKARITRFTGAEA